METAMTESRSAPPPPLGQQQSIDEVLRGLGRSFVPIRTGFVQHGKKPKKGPGPLAGFLTSRDEGGLDASLLVHALACAAPWNCARPSGFWVRTLGLVPDEQLTERTMNLVRPAVSKTMKRLVDRNMITRVRDRRRSSVTLLREDGSAQPYVRPKTADDQWFNLPHTYWHAGYYRTLSLPAKVMLLIALSQPPEGFSLPHERAPEWYGVSTDSACRGLRELGVAGLLSSEPDWVRTVRSDTGWTKRVKYRLLGKFSPKAQAVAATEMT